jgi:hypothetical protein
MNQLALIWPVLSNTLRLIQKLLFRDNTPTSEAKRRSEAATPSDLQSRRIVEIKL